MSHQKASPYVGFLVIVVLFLVVLILLGLVALSSLSETRQEIVPTISVTDSGPVSSVTPVTMVAPTPAPESEAAIMAHQAALQRHWASMENMNVDLTTFAGLDLWLRDAGFTWTVLEDLDSAVRYIDINGHSIPYAWQPSPDLHGVIGLRSPWPTGILVGTTVPVNGVCQTMGDGFLKMCTQVDGFTGSNVLLLTDIQHIFPSAPPAPTREGEVTG